jgi:hypothetical protein
MAVELSKDQHIFQSMDVLVGEELDGQGSCSLIGTAIFSKALSRSMVTSITLR